MNDKDKDCDNKKVIEYRVESLESSVDEIKDAVRSIASSLQTLTRLEVQHAQTKSNMERAFDEIVELRKDFKEHKDNTDERIGEIETTLPTLKLSSKWVFLAVIGIVGLVGVAVVGLVLIHH